MIKKHHHGKTKEPAHYEDESDKEENCNEDDDVCLISCDYNEDRVEISDVPEKKNFEKCASEDEEDEVGADPSASPEIDEMCKENEHITDEEHNINEFKDVEKTGQDEKPGEQSEMNEESADHVEDDEGSTNECEDECQEESENEGENEGKVEESGSATEFDCDNYENIDGTKNPDESNNEADDVNDNDETLKD